MYYLLAGIPGLLIGISLLCVKLLKTIGKKSEEEGQGAELETLNQSSSSKAKERKDEGTERPGLIATVCQPALILLFLGAAFRHTGDEDRRPIDDNRVTIVFLLPAGFSFAYNARLYFLTYFPSASVGSWLTGVSIGGGATGVRSRDERLAYDECIKYVYSPFRWFSGDGFPIEWPLADPQPWPDCSCWPFL